MKHVKLFEQFISEIVDLVHVYDKDGELFGTGELVKTKGKKSLIRWDGSNEEWIDSNLVKMVESSSVKEAVKVTPESDVTIDDYMTDNSEEIPAIEIVGAIVSSDSEADFLDYFYEKYGKTAFTETDTQTLAKYYNEYLEEITAKETEEEEAEKEKEEGGDDPMADLDDMDI